VIVWMPTNMLFTEGCDSILLKMRDDCVKKRREDLI
jgi:hypothetical protein